MMNLRLRRRRSAGGRRTAASAAEARVSAEWMGRPLVSMILRPASTFVPASRTMTGTRTPTSRNACTTPSAIQSQRLMPAKMLTRMTLTLGSDRTVRKAVQTRSGLAPPPMSRKLAGAPAGKLDHVHRRHGEPGAVDDAADVAVEADIGRARCPRAALSRGILLAGIAQRGDLGTAEEGVGVEGHLGVERDQTPVAGHDQRIDLDHRRVEVAVGAVAGPERPSPSAPICVPSRPSLKASSRA